MEMEIGEGSSKSNGDLGDITCKIRDRVDQEKVSPFQFETECCIFRVPKLQREVKEDAYTPIVVSIGPYHRMDERLHSMERYKLGYLDSILDLSNGDKAKSDLLLAPYVKKIKEKEDQIRGSYADPISLSGDDFVQMVLLDSFFIIGFLGGWRFVQIQIQTTEILHDLLLLENQLPFLIINEIYEIRYPLGTCATTFSAVAAEFFSIINLPLHWDNCKHLLDLVRNSYVRRFQGCGNGERKGIPNTVSVNAPTASDLHAAGVKFKVVEHNNEEGLLNIKFDKHDGVLTIPKLVCYDYSECIFRNVSALEQCMSIYDDKPTYIIDYFYFMDCLINTKEDAQLLVGRGIIESWLGSDDAICDMFNTITKNMSIIISDYVYNGICEDLNIHCSKKRNKWMATLKNKYFAHPWAGISVSYAIVLLLLTIAQVVLAIVALP